MKEPANRHGAAALPPVALIVGPGGAGDNNGNWRTAARWARLLQPEWQCTIRGTADDLSAVPAQLMIALHARRSAAAVRAWSDAARGPLVLVLTGTDLYRDIAVDREARDSLARADRLVVLNEHGIADLPAEFRSRARCILQSCPAHPPVARGARELRALMVGHLRSEKAPDTWFAVARALGTRRGLRLAHIGAPLDASLGAEARQLAAQEPRYRYLGALSHAATLRRIRTAHVLVHPSRMEGGAHVVLEAVRNGTPVLASRIAGNIGMLGAGYAGYFECGDAAAVLALLDDCRASQGRDDGFLARLSAQCAERAPLFDPLRERTALLELLDEFNLR